MTHEDEEFNRIEMESRIRQEGVLAAIKQEQGEPVAWMYESVCGNDFTTRNKPPAYAKNIRPLGYTTPQQRTWVDLTEQELVDLRARVQEYTPIDSVKYGEAIQRAMNNALKEKNHDHRS